MWEYKDNGYNHSPKSPPKLLRRFSTPVSLPPIEKLGSNDRGLPPQTVPITAKTVARSTPIPYTTTVSDLVRYFL